MNEYHYTWKKLPLLSLYEYFEKKKTISHRHELKKTENTDVGFIKSKIQVCSNSILRNNLLYSRIRKHSKNLHTALYDKTLLQVIFDGFILF